MTKLIRNIIKDPQRRCCATCRNAPELISYDDHDPLLAPCHLQPNYYDRGGHPFIVMVANSQVCKRHEWRHTPAVIVYRQKTILQQ